MALTVRRRYIWSADQYNYRFDIFDNCTLTTTNMESTGEKIHFAVRAHAKDPVAELPRLNEAPQPLEQI